jgi:hypothetical protein
MVSFCFGMEMDVHDLVLFVSSRRFQLPFVIPLRLELKTGKYVPSAVMHNRRKCRQWVQLRPSEGNETDFHLMPAEKGCSCPLEDRRWIETIPSACHNDIAIISMDGNSTHLDPCDLFGGFAID